MMKSDNSLKFGLLCDSLTQPNWKAECLHKLVDHPRIELALVVINGESRNEKNSSNFPNKLSSFFYTIYRRNFLNPPNQNRKDITHLVKNAQRINVSPENVDGNSKSFSEDTVNYIKEMDLDFLLRLDFGILRGKVLEASRFGVWSFNYGDEQTYREGLPGFWEIYNEKPVTEVVLQTRSETHDGEVILEKGYFKTSFHSYFKTLKKIKHGAAEWPLKISKKILRKNFTLSDQPTVTNMPTSKKPSNFQFIKFLIVLIKNWINVKYTSLFETDFWKIAFLNQSISQALKQKNTLTPDSISDPDQNKYHADPFAIEDEGTINVLFEQYDYGPGSGEIKSLNLNPNKVNLETITRNSVPFENRHRDKHMSYPYLIKWGGDVYCVPQISGINSTKLYKLNSWPDDWTPVTTILNSVAARDPTLLKFNDMWWIFYTCPNQFFNSKLFAAYSKNITGPWKEHPFNPVKTDVRSSRPAGTPFTYEGELYRPAQDCSETYGKRIAINKIKDLSTDNFREKTVKYLEADVFDKNAVGVHTLSACGSSSFIDLKYQQFNWLQFKKTLRRNFPW